MTGKGGGDWSSYDKRQVMSGDKRQVMSGARRQEAGDRKGEEKTTGTRGNGQSKG